MTSPKEHADGGPSPSGSYEIYGEGELRRGRNEGRNLKIESET